MAKKVVNISKKIGKKVDNEIFNLNEEIVIGINSKNPKEKSKNTKNSKGDRTKNNAKSKKKTVKKITKKVVAKKPKSKLFITMQVILIIVLIVTGIILFLLSSIFDVKNIVVENNSKVNTQEVISLSGIIVGENTFKYINKDIIENIKRNSYIQEVNVKRNYPSEIVITLKEREINYTVNLGGNYANINKEGYIVEIIAEKPKYPEVLGLKTPLEEIELGKKLNKKDIEKLEKINIMEDSLKTNEIPINIITYTFKEDMLEMFIKDEKYIYKGF